MTGRNLNATKRSQLSVKKHIREKRSQHNIVEIAVANGSFTTLVDLLVKTGLDSTLKGTGPFTVFAPTDDAFKKVPSEVLTRLANEELKTVLTYHVVAGKHMAADVTKIAEATTVQGSPIHFSAEHGVKVNSASVVTADVIATNGVIHVIDEVLLPKA